MLKRRLFLAVLACAAALAGGTAAPASSSHAAPVAITKTCHGSYTHAVIGGVHKCLRAGQFCAHRYDSQYRRYGYRCTRYYPNVQRYRLTYA